MCYFKAYYLNGFQISFGYFISDLAMILWFYPTLGGNEYVCFKWIVHFSNNGQNYVFFSNTQQTVTWSRAQVIHHLLSMFSISVTLCSGHGNFYVYMVFLSEITTPFVNLRWLGFSPGLDCKLLLFCFQCSRLRKERKLSISIFCSLMRMMQVS
jgi:hypothetical protein